MNVILVEDHAPTREEVSSLLEKQEDITVVGHAVNGEEALSRAAELRPALIVMDIIMPGMNGIEATRAIRGANPDALVIALSNHTGSDMVNAALEAGASGYVRKDRAYEDLVPAIRAVAAGKRYIGARVYE